MFAGLLDVIKIPAAALAGMMLTVLYYEGLPIISSIPYIGSVPAIGELAVGRVEAEREKARSAALDGYVSRVELKQAQERAEELERQIKRNADAALAAQQQAEIARAEADKARADLERKIEDENDARASRWTEFDLLRLRDNSPSRATGPP